MGKRTIIFRADGNESIGMGHFIRTLALAEMLNQDFHCIFATKTPSQYQIDEIEKVCHKRIDLPTDKTHFTKFLDLLNGDEIVVLDNYYFTTQYQHEIKNKGCRLVCIDDLHDEHFVADIIINHAEGISSEDYSVEPYSQLLLGYNYALLRKEYLEEDINLDNKKYSYFLMMGGADPHNLTHHILNILELKETKLPIAVVVGSGYKENSSLSKFCNVALFKSITSAQVFRLMLQSQFGILPASTVAIEACAARLPFICGYFINNQSEIYNGIKTSNLAVCIGNYLDINEKKLLTAQRKLSEINTVDTIKINQRTKLDKKSKERFLKVFHSL
ncbi:UDP-2,4-diacetamido-2,4,6-trideoxy-beta-L-altropyranose hydrolase [Prolixibacter sp. NT017]|uniref:UDP-2,4-diacetamido-2,4, 6-trideoxy-beta-L-altropyranose hydrolase n=1 Tax=Prolixibacter sp. NT017 TaxID=2652390 RepID=UPI00127DCBE1|nr:UDP-2,4-diacetamido-2,4,6-trideoxy-beta-L-altropyranose hydrolase [Prolixibacter sp. NT017]GET24196.1 hypothetical protein NT017_05250 [Prolixibacter sp. NT017]